MYYVLCGLCTFVLLCTMHYALHTTYHILYLHYVLCVAMYFMCYGLCTTPCILHTTYYVEITRHSNASLYIADGICIIVL